MTSSQSWPVASAAAYMTAMVGTVSWIVLALILSADYSTHLFSFIISCVTLAVVTLLTSSSPRKTS